MLVDLGRNDVGMLRSTDRSRDRLMAVGAILSRAPPGYESKYLRPLLGADAFRHRSAGT